MSGLAEHLDAIQRRHSVLSFPLAVIYKFIDDQGSYLAALITYYGFLSLFPLLLLLSSVLGFVLRGDSSLQQHVLTSAFAQFPVVGREINHPARLGGKGIGLAVGIVGSLYGGLGVGQAGQNAMNVAWAVPRNDRPNPFKGRGRSVLLLATVGVGVLATTVVSGFSTSAGAFGTDFGVGIKAALMIVSVAINLGLFLVAFKIGTAVDLPWRTLLPGASIAAVVWQALQLFGSVYVQHVVRHAAATNAVFALVLGLIAWIYLGALVAVLCVEVNVVRAKRLHPRSLLTPFTDNVSLTSGDMRSYSDAAKAQREKGFETIDVTFDKPAGTEPSDRDG